MKGLYVDAAIAAVESINRIISQIFTILLRILRSCLISSIFENTGMAHIMAIINVKTSTVSP